MPEPKTVPMELSLLLTVMLYVGLLSKMAMMLLSRVTVIIRGLVVLPSFQVTK